MRTTTGSSANANSAASEMRMVVMPDCAIAMAPASTTTVVTATITDRVSRSTVSVTTWWRAPTLTDGDDAAGVSSASPGPAGTLGTVLSDGGAFGDRGGART